jgi:hypothetical protein
LWGGLNVVDQNQIAKSADKKPMPTKIGMTVIGARNEVPVSVNEVSSGIVSRFGMFIP